MARFKVGVTFNFIAEGERDTIHRDVKALVQRVAASQDMIDFIARSIRSNNGALTTDISITEIVDNVNGYTEEGLIAEYQAWQKEQGIGPLGSADEHIFDASLTVEQRRWLARFCERWNAMESSNNRKVRRSNRM